VALRRSHRIALLSGGGLGGLAITAVGALAGLIYGEVKLAERRIPKAHDLPPAHNDTVWAAAGVSRATVFTSVGGKAKLLKTALDVAIVGDDEPIALPDRPRSKAIRAEPDPRKYLALYAELVTEMDSRMASIHEAVRGAAGVDPDARALWESHLAQHRKGAANVIGDLARKGGLRADLDPDTAADIVWLLGPGTYHMLVHRRGWSPERFQAWLTATYISQLLPQKGARRRTD